MNLKNGIFMSLVKNNPKQLILYILAMSIPVIVFNAISAILYKLFKNPKYCSKALKSLLYVGLGVLIGYYLNDMMFDDIVIYGNNDSPLAAYKTSIVTGIDFVTDKGGLFVADMVRYEDYRIIKDAKDVSAKEHDQAVDFIMNINNNNPKNEYSGIFKDKNLIMILAESLDEHVIDEKLTPNLYKMKTEGIYFDKHYAPLYENHTSDSEFISQTGWIPSIEYGSTYNYYSDVYYPYTLAKLFDKYNYTSKAYHGYYEYYYNRENMIKALGFDEYIGASKMGIDKDTKLSLSGSFGYPKDEEIVRYMLDDISDDQPFYSLFMSLSGHSSYFEERPDIQEKLAIINADERFNDMDAEAKSYFAAQMLLDDAIGYIISYLQENDMMDDTVICLFNDHYPYGLTDESVYHSFDGYENEFDKYKGVWMIYNPTIEPLKVKKITSTFDIFPTLANMFSLDTSKTYMVGQDVMSDNDGYVLFANGSILTKECYYDATNGNIQYLTNKQSDSNLPNLVDTLGTYRMVGQDILRDDTYRKLLNP